MVGTLDPEQIGNYVYEKFDTPHHVLVFRMGVIEVHDEWPEQGFRERAWLTVGEAIDRVDEPGLRELLRRTFAHNRPDHITFALS